MKELHPSKPQQLKLHLPYGWERANRIERLNKGRTVYSDGKNYYSLDTQHGRFEKIDMKNGKHLGEVNIDLKPISGTIDTSGQHNLKVK
mgnify:CR=1 FL=1